MPEKIDIETGRGTVKKSFYTKKEIDSFGIGGGMSDRLMQRMFDGAASHLNSQLDQLSSDIDQSINSAFDTAGFYYNNQINEVTDALNNSIQNGGNSLSFNEVTTSEADGILVTGYDRSTSPDTPITRINLRGDGTTSDGQSFAGIFIQKNEGTESTPNWVTNFWANGSGDLFMNGNLQLSEGSVLVGTRNDPTVFISQEPSFEGISVTGDTSRTVIGEGSDDQGTTFEGISIQKNIGSTSSPDWQSNFYADANGDVFLRGEIVANSGFLGTLTVDGTISSSNYVAGSDGFSIDGITGNAEFNNITARGQFIGTLDGYDSSDFVRTINFNDGTANLPVSHDGLVTIKSALNSDIDVQASQPASNEVVFEIDYTGADNNDYATGGDFELTTSGQLTIMGQGSAFPFGIDYTNIKTTQLNNDAGFTSYDSTDFANESIFDLSDVTSASAGQYLKYDGTNVYGVTENNMESFQAGNGSSWKTIDDSDTLSITAGSNIDSVNVSKTGDHTTLTINAADQSTVDSYVDGGSLVFGSGATYNDELALSLSGNAPNIAIDFTGLDNRYIQSIPSSYVEDTDLDSGGSVNVHWDRINGQPTFDNYQSWTVSGNSGTFDVGEGQTVQFIAGSNMDTVDVTDQGTYYQVKINADTQSGTDSYINNGSFLTAGENPIQSRAVLELTYSDSKSPVQIILDDYNLSNFNNDLSASDVGAVPASGGTFSGAVTVSSGTLTAQGGIASKDVASIQGSGTFPSSGAGLELLSNSSAGVIQSYDRTNTAWYDLWLYGKELRFYTNGTEQVSIGGNGTLTAQGGIDAVGSGEILTLTNTANGDSATGYIRWKDSGGGNMAYIGFGSSNNSDIIFNNQYGGSLRFYTNGGERAEINSTGLGVGKTPTEALDVNGNIAMNGSIVWTQSTLDAHYNFNSNKIDLGGNVTLNGGTNVSISEQVNGTSDIQYTISASTSSGGVVDELTDDFGNPVSKASIQLAGSGTISTTVFPSGIDISDSSDRRMKKDIRDLSVTDVYRRFMSLQPRTFTWRKELAGSRNYLTDNDESMGQVAQEFAQHFPELTTNVNSGLFEDGKYGIDYSAYSGSVLTVMLQHAMERIEELEQQVKA